MKNIYTSVKISLGVQQEWWGFGGPCGIGCCQSDGSGLSLSALDLSALSCGLVWGLSWHLPIHQLLSFSFDTAPHNLSVCFLRTMRVAEPGNVKIPRW
uniref:Uncharacterized protein n=1 Tax=Knipowitschia caucasica TaxID=637954 RepID=A0AAV2MDZ1_KNICA